MCRHLKTLLEDEARAGVLVAEHNGILLDFCRQNVTQETMEARGRAMGYRWGRWGARGGGSGARPPATAALTRRRSPRSPLSAPPPSQLLLALAEAAGVRSKIDAMFGGQHINATEDRAVLHVALRAPRDAVIEDAGKNVVPEVWEVLDRIKAFSGGWVSG